jgi:sulfite exporter TauE/SafE
VYRLRVLAFIVVGAILGALGFWLVPMALADLVPYDKAVFGSSLFLFIAWIFINVHHYFLDNVMWRRGNPEVSKYLFR